MAFFKFYPPGVPFFFPLLFFLNLPVFSEIVNFEFGSIKLAAATILAFFSPPLWGVRFVPPNFSSHCLPILFFYFLPLLGRETFGETPVPPKSSPGVAPCHDFSPPRPPSRPWSALREGVSFRLLFWATPPPFPSPGSPSQLSGSSRTNCASAGLSSFASHRLPLFFTPS